VDPYRQYYGTIGLLKDLEINGRVTQVIGVKTGLGSAYGDYKDKAIDLKYQFWREGKYSPALAIGIMDPHGTSLYAAQFLVASKQVYPFDFTIGFGNGRFGTKPLYDNGNELFNAQIFRDPGGWLRDSSLFGGIQFSPNDRYSFIAEYNPIRYQLQTTDPAQPKYFRRSVPSKFNFGLRWTPLSWIELDLTYQRGNQIGLNLSFSFDIGEPLIPIYDKPYRPDVKTAALSPVEKIYRALKEQGFRDIGVAQEGETLLVRVQNEKFFYSMKALGIVLETVAANLDRSTERISVTFTENGIPKFQVSTSSDDLRGLLAGRLTAGEFFYLNNIDTWVARAPSIPTKGNSVLYPGLKPSFQMFLNDPSGFFKYRFGVQSWITFNPWKGASIIGATGIYPVNNVTSSNVPPSEAVRSDLFRYERQKVGLDRLMFDQIGKTERGLYTRIALGYLETEYAGLDAEVALPLRNGRFLVGLQGSVVKKRDPHNPFLFEGNPAKSYYDVEFLNTRLNLPENDMWVDFKTGRFLGGDFGTRITVTKHVRGVDLSAWYSITDTSVFKDPFNRGYHDMGIGVTIPMRLFEGADTRTAYSFAISPWNRDVGQDLYRYRDLFGLIGRDTEVFLKRDRAMAR
jgi:hypothetical protein